MHYLLFFLFQFAVLFFLSRILTRSLSRAILRVTKNTDFTIRFFHFIFLPGVILHELSHLLTAEVMLVKTHGLNLMPERHGDELTMGSVEISKTDPIRRTIIGFAPVLIGFLVISVSTFYLLSDKSMFNQVVSFILIFIIVFEVGNTMFSSRRDLDGSIGLIIFLFLLIVALYIFGFNFQPFIDFINSPSSQNLLTRGIKLLMIPIIVDVVIIALSKLLISRN